MTWIQSAVRSMRSHVRRNSEVSAILRNRSWSFVNSTRNISNFPKEYEREPVLPSFKKWAKFEPDFTDTPLETQKNIKNNENSIENFKENLKEIDPQFDYEKIRLKNETFGRKNDVFSIREGEDNYGRKSLYQGNSWDQEMFSKLCATIGNWNQKSKTFLDLEGLLMEWDGKITNKMLSSIMRKAQNFEIANFLFLWAQKQPRFTIDGIHYNVLLLRAGNENNFKVVDKLFLEMESKGVLHSTRTYNTVLGGWGKAGEIQRAIQGFKEMETKKVERTIVTWNIMISVYSRASKVLSSEEMLEGALETFEGMKREGIKPNLTTFNSLLSVFGKTNNEEKGIPEILNEMSENNVDPDVFTFNTLINIFAKTGNIEKMKEWVQKMEDSNIKPDEVTFASIVEGYTRNGQIEEALKLFEEIKKKGFNLNVMTFTTLISVCGKTKRIKEAIELFEEMKKRRVKPDKIIYGAMIHACKKANLPKKVVDFVEEMEDNGYKLSVEENNMAISAYGLLKNFERVESLVQSLEDKVDHVTWVTVMDAFNKSESFEKAKEFHGFMMGKGVKPTLAVFGALIQTLTGLGVANEVENVLVQMRGFELKPDLLMYGMIMNLCVKSGEVDTAIRMFSEAKVNGLEPNVHMYNMLMDVYGNFLSNPHKALQLYLEMRGLGCKCDKATYGILVGICSKYQLENEAEAIKSLLLSEGDGQQGSMCI